VKLFLQILTGIIIVISATAFETEARLIKKGSISVGGSSNLGTDTMFIINGSVGYFLFNQVELGASCDYRHKHVNDNYYSDTKLYGIGPFIAYHIPVNDPSNFYIRCGFGYGKVETEHYEENGIETNISGGWEYFFTPSVASLIGLHYSHTFWDNTENFIENHYSLDFGLKIFF
jgi:outer membrane protein